MLKNIFVFCLLGLYLYTLTFGIFLTDIIRLPAPLIFGMPLLLFAKEPLKKFAYNTEVLLIIISLFLYYVIGMDDFKSFFSILIIIVVCSLYFNYYVGLNKQRFNLSVLLFFSFLLLSMVILVLDQFDQSSIDPIRTLMVGEEVQQSPSGVAVTQFNFGYQVAAFSSFVFVFVCAFRLNFTIKAVALGLCLTFLYLGMNRSAFVCVAAAVAVFLLIYYRSKAVLVIAATVLIGFGLFTYAQNGDSDNKNNIFAKNEAKADDEYNRSDMFTENLKICADYPFGLIFYGKNWEDVTYRHPLFAFGLTSHNSYLMFLTYLGPFLGFGLLLGIYYKFAAIFKRMVRNVELKSNALLLCLFFSFIAVSLNAMSHNGWLMSVDGPTLFLYFSVLHYEKVYAIQTNVEPILEAELVNTLS